jgi:hypothetical protein
VHIEEKGTNFLNLKSQENNKQGKAVPVQAFTP